MIIIYQIFKDMQGTCPAAEGSATPFPQIFVLSLAFLQQIDYDCPAQLPMGGKGLTSSREEVRRMSVFEALSLMIAFSMLVIAILLYRSKK